MSENLFLEDFDDVFADGDELQAEETLFKEVHLVADKGQSPIRIDIVKIL